MMCESTFKILIDGNPYIMPPMKIKLKSFVCSLSEELMWTSVTGLGLPQPILLLTRDMSKFYKNYTKDMRI